MSNVNTDQQSYRKTTTNINISVQKPFITTLFLHLVLFLTDLPLS